jgi:hypothetical protein
MRTSRTEEKTSAVGTALAAATLLLTAALAGCGVGVGLLSAPPAQVVGSSLQGKVFGGQQPISGAAIQLYAAGSTGYGSAATALIPAGSVTTNAGGNFNITGTYTCPSASTEVYITATGGNPGTGTNANIANVAALGPCGNLSPSTFVVINELTTVAAAYALSPFMTGPANIGAPASNAAGLANAFANVNVLVSIPNGAAPGPSLPAGASLSVAELNTLANILAACVNTAGGTAGDGSACGILFSAANPGGTSATAPGETFTAAMNIAQHPALNVSTLFPLSTPTAPFQPNLTAQPNDFTVAVKFTGGNLSSPSALAIDASNNVWVANAGSNTVTELSHLGSVLSGTGYTGSLNLPSAIAIDASDVVWVTNGGNNTVSRLNGTTGALLSGSPLSGGSLNQPRSVAFDSLGNAWIANTGNASLTVINSTGTTLTNYSPAGAAAPIAVGVNPH